MKTIVTGLACLLSASVFAVAAPSAASSAAQVSCNNQKFERLGEVSGPVTSPAWYVKVGSDTISPSPNPLNQNICTNGSLYPIGIYVGGKQVVNLNDELSHVTLPSQGGYKNIVIVGTTQGYCHNKTLFTGAYPMVNGQTLMFCVYANQSN